MRISGMLLLYLLGAILFSGRPLYMLLYLLGGVYLQVRLSLHHAVSRVQVERLLPEDRIFVGERVPITLRLSNPTAVAIPWLQYQESRPTPMGIGPERGVLTLGPGQRVEIAHEFVGERRGRFSIGPLWFEAGDPFGLVRFDRNHPETKRITVYPKVSPLPDLGLPARLPMGDLATRRRLFEDPAWLNGSRAYAPGDALKRIHWRATARTGELMVKQYRHAMLLPTCVALNLNQADYINQNFWLSSELAVRAAASLAQHLLRQKQQVGLLAVGVDPDQPTREPLPVRLPLRQGQGAMVDMLEVLARIEVGSTPPFAQVLLDEARHLPWGTLFCVVTAAETDAVATTCARLAAGGFQVLLFVTGSGASGRRAGYQVWQLHDSPAGEVVVG